MVKRFKKYESGEGNQYVSRLSALHKLQLSLNDFRRLCILKGIYPREPKNRKKAQRGDTAIKILYHKKDINFLMNEKLVWTLREMKIMNRRIKYADSIGDKTLKRMRLSKYPELKLDHVVKERYPTFIDAIKDLDDCLTLLFLFSTFPALKQVTRSQTALCRRLTVEFMHYVIAAKALKKVFVSIKGYYFQAEIKGQTVTWIVPHYYPFQPQAKTEVDFRIMSTFVEFYTIMCGFVNFRLFHSLNLIYPPQFGVSLDSEESQANEDTFVSERIAALNQDILKSSNEVQEEEEEEIDFQLMSTEEDSGRVKKMQQQDVEQKRLKTLFKNLKFFINREVPREPLVFIIRCFGGKVSWDKNTFVGATFDETDETITHQICDRPEIQNKYISRDYIQPQWVFDSVNQRKLLPTNKYFLGVKLPAHLSPFVNQFREEGEYVPPEEKALRDPSLIITHDLSDASDDEQEKPSGVELDFALEKAFNDENKEVAKKQKGQQQEIEEGSEGEEIDITDMLDNESDSEDGEEVEVAEKKEKKVVEKLDPEELKMRKREEEKKKMAVKAGKVFKVDPKKEKRLNEQELKLRAKMVKSRHKKLYYKLLEKRDKDTKEAKLLDSKRKKIEVQKKELMEKKMKTKKQKQKVAK